MCRNMSAHLPPTRIYRSLFCNSMRFLCEIWDNYFAIPESLRARATVIIVLFGFLYPFLIISDFKDLNLFSAAHVLFVSAMFIILICIGLGGVCYREICKQYDAELRKALGTFGVPRSYNWRIFKNSVWSQKAYKKTKRLVPYEIISDPIYNLSRFWMSLAMKLLKMFAVLIGVILVLAATVGTL